MDTMERDLEREKLDFFEELIKTGTDIDLWEYAMQGHLIYTKAKKLVLDQIFEHAGCKQYMLDHAGEYSAPLVLSGPMGLMWSAVYKYEKGTPFACYVLGPVFDSEFSSAGIEEYAERLHVNINWRRKFVKLMESLPVLPTVLFFQYTLMLHYCINGEKLERSALHFQKKEETDHEKVKELPQKGRVQTWQAERELLRMVREGDLQYHKALRNASLLSNGVRAEGREPIIKALVSCTTFTSLCVREAIHGGISPETAYSVGDKYIQSMISCENIAEMTALNHAMYEEFIQRVHRQKLGPKVSSAIRGCVDYIENHTEEELPLKLLASRVGYSEYHLSRKFKEETGSTISQFIRKARVEKSRYYLEQTDETIGQIADRFRFCSGSHYAEAFREIMGKKPKEYREEQKKF